jgi:hypothetical protein
MPRTLIKGAATSVVAMVLACGSSNNATSSSGNPDAGTGTSTVGTTGGTVSLSQGPTLSIPANALGADVTITIARSAATAPTGALSPIFQFGPDGTTFAQPVTVTFPVTAGATAASLYWTKSGSTTQYDALLATVSGTNATAQVTHFSQGFIGAPCSDGTSCTSTNACHTAAVGCSTGAPVCTDSGFEPDLTSCGDTNVCSSGSCVPATCTPGQTCTPTTANACKVFETTCANPLATPVCAAGENAGDGTSCATCAGSSCVCSSGTCVVETRTVSGTVQTFFVSDDGTNTAVAGIAPEEQQQVTGLIFADDSPAGYTTVPITFDAASHFSVSNIPVGTYYLQLDQVAFINQPDPALPGSGQTQVLIRGYWEMTSSTPDLTAVVAGRPDRKEATGTTNVTLSMTDGVAWATGDSIIITDSNASVYQRPLSALSPKPLPGDKSISGTFDWNQGQDGGSAGPFLPDASKGDITWLYHRSRKALAANTPSATTMLSMTEFAKLTDLTIPNGGPGSITASLVPVAQTGNLPGDFRASAFAGLASAVNPGAEATPASLAIDGPFVFAAHSTLVFPNMTIGDVTPLGGYQIPSAGTDVDYGTVHYGQFLDSGWQEYVQLLHNYDFVLSAPGNAQQSFTFFDTYLEFIPVSSAPASWTPILSPATVPRIGGVDAFTTHTLGTATPVISWSPPATGTATRYEVAVSQTSGTFNAGDVVTVFATLYSGTSFKFPGGFIKQGEFYEGQIVAQNTPAVLDSPIFAAGLPFTSVGCDFGLFTP